MCNSEPSNSRLAQIVRVLWVQPLFGFTFWLGAFSTINGPISLASLGPGRNALGFANSYTSLHVYTRVYLALSLGGHGLYDFIIIIVAPRVNV